MKYYLEGTKFKLISKLEMVRNPESEEYILAELREAGYVFQIICISGYRAGKIFGYIKEDEEALRDNIRGVSETHLIKELKRNMFFDESSLQFFDGVGTFG